MKLWARAAFLAALPFLAACPMHPMVATPPRPAPTRDVYVLLLILDGGRSDTVYQAVADGVMPNTKQYIFDRGARVKDAIAVFPSVTTSGHQSFITGLLPGHSGITGLDWFDRASGRVTDYLSMDVMGIDEDLLNKTNPAHPEQLFSEPDNLIRDLMPGSAVATVYEPFHMETSDFAPKFPMLSFVYHFVRNENQELTKGAANDLRKIYERPLEKIPRFVMGTFLGHDVCQHHYGSGSPQHIAEMKLEDEEVGEIVARMKKAGIWDKTYIVLAADHGQHPTGRYVSIPRILRAAGLRPRGYYAAQVNTYSSLIAITSANIYLNKGQWSDVVTLADLHSFPTASGKRIDLLETLLKKEAVEFAIVPEPPDRVHILGAGTRHGVITRRSFNGSDYFSYTVPEGARDPLHYDDASFRARSATLVPAEQPADASFRARSATLVPAEQPAEATDELAGWVNDGHFHAADDWAHATRDSLYPDAPLQLMQLFDGDRAGDLVVTARPGWHFKPRDYVSSHGGMGRDDMRVPLVISGPDIAGGSEIPAARIADVYPTLRRIFGLPVTTTARMDGRPLDEILPFVPASDHIPARHASNPEADDYFADLASLETFVQSEENSLPAVHDPAALFRNLKRLDGGSFAEKLAEEIGRDTQLRREVSAMRDSLGDQVRQLDRTVQLEGRDGYNDPLYGERHELTKEKERSYILARTLDRLDVRISRGNRLQQVLSLVRVAHDLDELRGLYVKATPAP